MGLLSCDDAELVSCIMPTYNRRQFVGHAIDYFQRQDYPRLELIIIDDGEDPIEECLPTDERIRYVRLRSRLSVGAKRNEACRLAGGSIIVHWDDDDWYSPSRVTKQVQTLVSHGADVCGTSELYYYNPAHDRAWRYIYRKSGGLPWVAGNTLAYRKTFWERNCFPDISVGEDSRFLWSKVPKVIYDSGDLHLCIGMIHNQNVSPKRTSGSYWQRCSRYEIDQLLSDDLRRYRDGNISICTFGSLVSQGISAYNR